jgi:hypothetical protein
MLANGLNEPKENLEGRTNEIVKKNNGLEGYSLQNTKIHKQFSKLPEVLAGKGVWQNAFHEFDVYGHTIDYVRNLDKLTLDPDLIAAGYLHDIGKPLVAKVKMKKGEIQEKEPGKPYHEFEAHEKVGEEMVRNMDLALFKELRLDQGRIARLVGAHFLPMIGIKAMRNANNYSEFKSEYHQLEQVLDDTYLGRENVLLMFLADKLAQGKFCTDQEELFAIRNSLLTANPTIVELYDLQKNIYGGKE